MSRPLRFHQQKQERTKGMHARAASQTGPATPAGNQWKPQSSHEKLPATIVYEWCETATILRAGAKKAHIFGTYRLPFYA